MTTANLSGGGRGKNQIKSIEIGLNYEAEVIKTLAEYILEEEDEDERNFFVDNLKESEQKRRTNINKHKELKHSLKNIMEKKTLF